MKSECLKKNRNKPKNEKCVIEKKNKIETNQGNTITMNKKQ